MVWYKILNSTETWSIFSIHHVTLYSVWYFFKPKQNILFVQAWIQINRQVFSWTTFQCFRIPIFNRYIVTRGIGLSLKWVFKKGWNLLYCFWINYPQTKIFFIKWCWFMELPNEQMIPDPFKGTVTTKVEYNWLG